MNDDASANIAGDLPADGLTEIDAKLELIKASYAEVLDATKHQDDKIGQLLTSIAFLTAATLALAALGMPSFITRTFAAQPFELPLGLIALAAFLVAVLFSVILLLTSLFTPLRLPGLGKKNDSAQSSRKNDSMQWVRGVAASQIYFHEISRVSLDQWKYKWEASADDLKGERLNSLIHETHNLGLRTNAKSDRTSEAVALLSFSLLAFALSGIFVAIIAGSAGGHAPIVLKPWQRVIIAGIFGGYFWAQLLGQIRYSRQAVDEAPPRNIPKNIPSYIPPKEVSQLGKKFFKLRKDLHQFRGELWYAVLVGALVIDTLIYDRSWPVLAAWIAMTVTLTFACLISSWYAAEQDFRRSLKLGVPAIVGAGLAISCGVKGWYAGQLAVVSLAVLCLIGYAILLPTLSLRRDRQDYWHKEMLKAYKLQLPP